MNEVSGRDGLGSEQGGRCGTKTGTQKPPTGELYLISVSLDDYSRDCRLKLYRMNETLSGLVPMAYWLVNIPVPFTANIDGKGRLHLERLASALLWWKFRLEHSTAIAPVLDWRTHIRLR